MAPSYISLRLTLLFHFLLLASLVAGAIILPDQQIAHRDHARMLKKRVSNIPIIRQLTPQERALLVANTTANTVEVGDKGATTPAAVAAPTPTTPAAVAPAPTTAAAPPPTTNAAPAQVSMLEKCAYIHVS